MLDVSKVFVKCEEFFNKKEGVNTFLWSIPSFEKDFLKKHFNDLVGRFWSGVFNGVIGEHDDSIKLAEFKGDVKKARQGFILLYGLVFSETKQYRDFLKEVVKDETFDLLTRRLAVSEAVFYGYARDFYDFVINTDELDFKLSFVFNLKDVGLLLKLLKYAVDLLINKRFDREYIDLLIINIVDRFDSLFDQYGFSIDYKTKEELKNLLWTFINQPVRGMGDVKKVINFLAKRLSDGSASKVLVNNDRMAASQELFKVFDMFKRGDHSKFAGELINLSNKSKPYSFVFNLVIVPKLINALESGELDFVKVSDELSNFIVRVLARSRPSPKTITFLKGLFKHESEVVRRAIVEESEKVFNPEDRLKLIQPLINDPSSFVREAVVHELVELKSRASINLLVDLFLSERSHSVRNIIFNYLLNFSDPVIIDKLVDEGLVSSMRGVVNNSIRLLSSDNWLDAERIRIICLLAERAKGDKPKHYLDCLKRVKINDLLDSKLVVEDLVELLWLCWFLSDKEGGFYTVCKQLFDRGFDLFDYEIEDGHIRGLDFSVSVPYSKELIDKLIDFSDLKFLGFVFDFDFKAKFDLSGLHLESLSLSFRKRVSYDVFDKLKNSDLKRLSLSLRNPDFPSSLFELKRLEYLSLSSKEEFALPKEIEKLENLEVLDLSSSDVRSLPSSILNLKQLKKVIFSTNADKYFSRVTSSRSSPMFGSVVSYYVDNIIYKLKAKGVKIVGNHILEKGSFTVTTTPGGYRKVS